MCASLNGVPADPLGVALGALEVGMVHVGIPVATFVAIPGTVGGTVGDTLLPALITAARSNRFLLLVWLPTIVYDTSGVFGKTVLLLLLSELAVGCFSLI